MVEEKKKQEVMKIEERSITYTAADGQEVRLTPELVKKYLVQGNSELVTMQELSYFLNICRARRLNPLVKDCYLIKYSAADPAAIVTSIDFFRKRARVMKDCVGWQKGVIVKGKAGLRDSFGLVGDDEELVGGWFEAQPTGWTKPFRIEVNLKGYLKKTKEGNLTRFWSPENQPTMIAKVAEAQGLRTLWPDEFMAIFTAEEGATPVFEIPEAIDIATHGRFEELVAEKKMSPEDTKLFGEYMAFQANKNKVDLEALQGMAERDFANFMEYFKVFKTKKEAEGKSKTPVSDKEEKKETPKKKETDGEAGFFGQEKELREEGEKPTK